MKLFEYIFAIIIMIIMEYWYIVLIGLSIAYGLYIVCVSRKQECYYVEFDKMSGDEFESFCLSLLKKNGFTKGYITKKSGDHGVDIVARKNKKIYAIQCKRYSQKVGNRAIQEIYSGKDIYNADVAVVITNNYFTQQAIQDAKTLNVKLWDRKKLIDLIQSVNNEKLV